MTEEAPRIVTFGCRLNAYESEVMRGHAEAAGLHGAVIVNTCAVTAEAERQARQTIRRLRRDHPGARLIVTGCAAQNDADGFAAMPEVDRVLGNADKMRRESWRADGDSVSDAAEAPRAALDAPGVTGLAGRHRAFLQVQQGCDHACTFCIVPATRGPAESLAPETVVERARALVENGTPEVVLSGVDVASWGADLPGRPGIAHLARRLLRDLPALRRLRLSSLDPTAVDDALADLFAEEARLLPHVHLSAQAGDDMVLKRMGRRHRRDDVLAAARRLREARPGMTVGADLIAGFPTETEDQAANTRTLVEEAGLAPLHVFPYSGRPGTAAERMPQVPGDVRRDRAARLREAGARELRRSMAGRVGGTTRVLAEADGTGRADDYLPVRFVGARPEPGTVAWAALVDHDDDALMGEVLTHE